MNIMLCGTAELKLLLNSFIKVCEEVNCNPICFLDGSIKHSNDQNWKKNSTESVAASDILVFVILEKYGEITWKTEYKQGLKLGKKIIIFCEEHIWTTYNTVGSNVVESNEHYLLFLWLRELINNQKTIIPFQNSTFEKLLKKQILDFFHDSASKFIGRTSKIGGVKSKNARTDLKTLTTKLEGLSKEMAVLYDDIRNIAAQFAGDSKEIYKQIENYRNETIGIVNKIATESNNKIRNLGHVGIHDAYEGLQIRQVFDILQDVENVEFGIMRIHFSEPEWRFLRSHILELIKKSKYQFNILLLSPTENETISLRLKYTDLNSHIDLHHYLKNIVGQLKALDEMRNTLAKFDLKDKLQIRIHKDFLSFALMHYQDEILYSSYLHGQYSEDAVQIRVKGESRILYKELFNHFRQQWDNSDEYTVTDNKVCVDGIPLHIMWPTQL